MTTISKLIQIRIDREIEKMNSLYESPETDDVKSAIRASEYLIGELKDLHNMAVMKE